MKRLIFICITAILFLSGLTTNEKISAQIESDDLEESTVEESIVEEEATEEESVKESTVEDEATEEESVKESTVEEEATEEGSVEESTVEDEAAEKAPVEESIVEAEAAEEITAADEEADIEKQFKDDAFLQAIKEKVKANGHDQLSYAALKEIKELTDIRELGIESIEGVELLKELKELELRGNNITDLTPLSELDKLEILDLRNNAITSIEGIETLINLKELDIRGNHVISLTPVKNLTALEALDFRDNSVSDISAVENLVNLIALNARNNAVADLGPIAKLIELEELNMHTNQISDLTPLENLTKIKNLVLRRNKISDISVLENLVLLEDLNIRDNNITDLSPLRNLNYLTVRLNLRDNPITDFSPVASYYDKIEDTDFVISDGPAIDFGDFNLLDGTERIAMLQKYIKESNQHISDHTVRQSKLEQLSANPFAFYRGTASLFFLDVKNQVVDIPENWTVLNQGETWITGDLHIENLGFYGNRNGEAIFELNDFDEVAIAPFYFDLLNFGTGLYLLNDAAPNLQLDAEGITEVVEQYGMYYREAIENVANGSINIQEHYFTKDNLDGFIGDFAKKVSEEPLNNQLATWTTVNEDRMFDLTNNRLEAVTDEENKEIKDNWDSYLSNIDEDILTDVGSGYFEIKDIARRVDAGLGSLGYDRYYVLIEGKTDSAADDIILDVKAQGASAVEASGLFTGDSYPTNASRTINGVNALLNYPDIHWGTLETENQSYLVKERSPYKDEVGPTDIGGKDDLDNYIKASAEVTAYAHSRAASHIGNDNFAANLSQAFQELNNFDKDLAEVTLKYYAQVNKDHELYTALYKDQAFEDINEDENKDDSAGEEGQGETGSDEGENKDNKNNDGDNAIGNDNENNTGNGEEGQGETGSDEGENKDNKNNDGDNENNTGNREEGQGEIGSSEGKNNDSGKEGTKNNLASSGDKNNEKQDKEELLITSSDNHSNLNNEELLPDTATSMFNYLILGIVLLLTGSTVFWIYKRKNTEI
ncbi:DUF2252 family protein [Gracilibacillus alcaliphilus]|uniref:DUF2252 family protein n=1 Tax=Gracilibacillus alcaliphilus TaxID=1401441 RepID=UPI00195C9EC2|nr:DUF2252 family protein [Gracilibacillus alcaliphilus]MBM7677723.1 LPXTG-motif cell wall-anchored protein [Gracilibacillus alcaliphilus]